MFLILKYEFYFDIHVFSRKDWALNNILNKLRNDICLIKNPKIRNWVFIKSCNWVCNLETTAVIEIFTHLKFFYENQMIYK